MAKTPDEIRTTFSVEKVKSRITSSQVAEYLRRHPQFLVRHPELLDYQTPPARSKGEGIIDLQQFMVERLRRDIAKLRADQDDLLANSRDNLSTQDRIHKAVLSMLAAESFEKFIEMVTTDLVLLLDVDVVTLCVEALDDKAPLTEIEGVHVMPPGGVVEAMGDDDILLRDDAEGDAAVFGGGAGLVRSDALIRLKISERTPPCLLGFGTRHPGYFNPGQGTELLNFLARIVEHCIRQWLGLPHPSP
jgi:uncharacterized protein